jgi:glycogen operon protein
MTSRLQGRHASRGPAWASAEGQPYPLGVSRVSDQNAYNFALYSKHASSVRLLLFADDFEKPLVELNLDPLRNKSGRIWHCRVPRSIVSACRYYAYRVDGPTPAGPFELHAFHPEKVLFDPYARSIFFPPGFERSAAIGDVANAGKAPLGVILPGDSEFDWGDEPRPRSESDAIVYELHVKGFTEDPSSGVSPEARGRFAGVIEKIPYLRELGVNVVELMPVFQFDPQSGDFWGYMPLSFFAPHHAYARDPRTASSEFSTSSTTIRAKLALPVPSTATKASTTARTIS